MTGYVWVKPNTDIWNRLNELENCLTKWFEHREEIESFLGFPMEDGLILRNDVLEITEEALERYRPEWKPFFKNDGTSRIRSQLYQSWRQIVMTHELKVYTFKTHVKMAMCTPLASVKAYYKFGADYYLEVDRDRFMYEKNYWAVPVRQSKFLRLYADQLEVEELQQA